MSRKGRLRIKYNPLRLGNSCVGQTTWCLQPRNPVWGSRSVCFLRSSLACSVHWESCLCGLFPSTPLTLAASWIWQWGVFCRALKYRWAQESLWSKRPIPELLTLDCCWSCRNLTQGQAEDAHSVLPGPSYCTALLTRWLVFYPAPHPVVSWFLFMCFLYLCVYTFPGYLDFCHYHSCLELPDTTLHLRHYQDFLGFFP